MTTNKKEKELRLPSRKCSVKENLRRMREVSDYFRKMSDELGGSSIIENVKMCESRNIFDEENSYEEEFVAYYHLSIRRHVEIH